MDGADWDIELLFDGDCPLCAREVAFLRRLDRRGGRAGRVRFTDITSPTFDPWGSGRTRAQLMARFHGRLPDGAWVEGVEAFRRAYAAVGLGPLVQLTRLPGVAWLLDRAYAVFARNRLRWTGRPCDGACASSPRRTGAGHEAADPADGAARAARTAGQAVSS